MGAPNTPALLAVASPDGITLLEDTAIADFTLASVFVLFACGFTPGPDP